LAGSERVSNHNNLEEVIKDSVTTLVKCKEDRVKEGKSINKSLFFLTQVISLKAEGKTEHIPYRNSPLTKILKSSLGGNSRTFIMLCTTPSHSQYEQTLGTIRFGMSAKKIENVISANITTHNNADAYQLIINEYEERLKQIELLRGADQKKVEYMVKIISDLQKQKDELNQKLRRANKKRLLRAMKEKGVEEVVNGTNIFNELHRPGIGLIFTSKKHNQIKDNNTLPCDNKEFFAITALRNEKQKNALFIEKCKVLNDGIKKIVKIFTAEIKEQRTSYDQLNTKHVNYVFKLE